MSDIISKSNPKSVIAESIKILRTNLEFSNVDKNIKTIMITSAIAGEGKSFTSANLAIAYANLGKKTLLVDCDMRRGTQHIQFEISNSHGLSELLIDKNPIYSNYIKQTKIENVSVVNSGTVPPNPSELLSSKSFDKFLEEMKKDYDIIILDLPPVTLVPDASIVATKVDKTIIVTRIKVTPVAELEKTKRMLENVNADIAGVVVNGVKTSTNKYYNNYYN